MLLAECVKECVSRNGVRFSYRLNEFSGSREAGHGAKAEVGICGGVYHVICRGNQRQVIFRSDADRKYYLERVEGCLDAYNAYT